MNTKKILYKIIALILLVNYKAIGQKSVYDTTDKYYSGVNFSFEDDLKYWIYKFKKRKPSSKNPAIGSIAFWRTEKWDDYTDKEFHMSWNPGISFEIFYLKDSAFARDISEKARLFSSCSAPQVGGDVFVIGSFLFVNPVSCVLCYRGKNKTEYCRPTINKLFSNLDLDKISSIKDLVNRLPIKRTD